MAAIEKQVFPNYPYPPDSEPNESWTVEQALQYCLIQAHKETEAKYHQIEASLNLQFEKGKNEIWDCHENVVIASKAKSQDPDSDGKGPAKAIANEEPAIPTTINILITEGQYIGSRYKLVPRSRQPCWVGRSQGKKFKERGMSLVKDLEISTTHGKFELVGGRLHYTDTGSTNGSKARGDDLRPNTPFPLEEGLELILGQSVLKISLS